MMIKKLFLTCILVFASASGALANDAFSFENFAIVDSGDANILSEPVSINSGGTSASVGSFDIAGVILGMSFEDVYSLFFESGNLYNPREENSLIYTIHKDWKYNLDYECREQNIYAPDDLEKCINSFAADRGLMYASELHLERPTTGEKIIVYFTSNATDNRVWRVVYNNDVNEIQGDNEKFENIRQKKILVFWQGILEKYGAPNSGSDKWVSSSNSYDPMMTAYYGALDLVDLGIHATDAAKNVNDSKQNFRAKPYSF